MHEQLKDERVRKNHELDERARTILELDERRSLSPSSSIDERDERNEGNQPRDELWEIVINDRLGRKVRVKCSPYDTIDDLKALTAAQIGTNRKRIIFKLGQYNEIRHVPGLLIWHVLINGQNIELFYL